MSFSLHSALPGNSAPAGVDLGTAIVLPPGGQVFYVRGNGTTVTEYNLDPPGLRERLSASVAQALSYCVSGRGDVVAVLPGHTESLAVADSWANLVANTRIVGIGTGTARPTFTWTASGSTLLLNVANVSIENCILNLEPGTGTVTVTAPITISAAGCRLIGNTIRVSTDSNNKSTIGITTTAAADDCEISHNVVYGATTGEVTTMLDIIGCDRLKMVGNVFSGATSSTTVGVVRFATTASTHIMLARNFYANRKASSAAAVTGLAGVTGCSFEELFHYLDDSSTTMWVTSPGSMAFYNPRTVNLAGEAGMLSTVVST